MLNLPHHIQQRYSFSCYFHTDASVHIHAIKFLHSLYLSALVCLSTPNKLLASLFPRRKVAYHHQSLCWCCPDPRQATTPRRNSNWIVRRGLAFHFMWELLCVRTARKSLQQISYSGPTPTLSRSSLLTLCARCQALIKQDTSCCEYDWRLEGYELDIHSWMCVCVCMCLCVHGWLQYLIKLWWASCFPGGSGMKGSSSFIKNAWPIAFSHKCSRGL